MSIAVVAIPANTLIVAHKKHVAPSVENTHFKFFNTSCYGQEHIVKGSVLIRYTSVRPIGTWRKCIGQFGYTTLSRKKILLSGIVANNGLASKRSIPVCIKHTIIITGYQCHDIVPRVFVCVGRLKIGDHIICFSECPHVISGMCSKIECAHFRIGHKHCGRS